MNECETWFDLINRGPLNCLHPKKSSGHTQDTSVCHCWPETQQWYHQKKKLKPRNDFSPIHAIGICVYVLYILFSSHSI